ncbi:molybdopterin molybdotransferase MoeA [Desulfovibrio oxyclinae]|uniref:molybdopterin molybdotransferase MoeA n=1 Tax=Desulfovibrio oxyclinae TaxID=63560 RepID=UPI00035FB5CE|nr:molybdopterin molybdotransferase MoeA [Desulfovibrio oxyclinae]
MLKNATRTQALEALLERVVPASPESLSPHRAVGRVLAEDAHAARPVPDSPRSSRDGYALDSSETVGATPQNPAELQISGVSAPDAPVAVLQEGHAMRILTGGPLAVGADAVLMDEEAQVTENTLAVTAETEAGQYVFPAGHDLPQGHPVGLRGETVTPAMAAVMTRSFVPSVTAHPPPRVAIYALGDELVRADQTPGAGAFRSDNLILASELLRRAGAEIRTADTVRDTPRDMRRTHAGFHDAQLVITMGGTGRGDRDLARKSAREAGFEILVDRLALRPGRTMFAATRADCLLLGFPGPPHAVSPLLHAFALPLVRALSGRPVSGERKAELLQPLHVRKGSEWLAPCTLEMQDNRLCARPLPEGLPPLAEIARLDTYLAVPGGAELRKNEIITVLPGPEFS